MKTEGILHYGNMSTLNQTQNESMSGMKKAFQTLPGSLRDKLSCLMCLFLGELQFCGTYLDTAFYCNGIILGDT